jgi:hypothetical protein
LLAAASVFARVVLALNRPLWFDETFTLWAARLPLKQLIAALRLDSGPPGFYVLEKPFALIADRFAESDPLLRVPSFLSVLLLFAAARTLPRGAARSSFVALLSGSALLNLYAGEARPYALLAVSCLALFLLALRGRETGRRLLACAGVTAIVLYTHYLALFAVAALLALALRARRWRSCAALLSGAAIFVPWIPVLRAQPPAAVAWIRETAPASVVGFLSAFGGVGRLSSQFGPPVPLLFFGGAAAGALSLVWLLAHARLDPDVRDAAAFVILVLGGALLVGVWKPIAFAGRTELAVLPVWFWGLARAAPESRTLRRSCVAITALGFLATLGAAFQPHPPPASEAVTENIARVAQPGDRVLAAASFYLPARLASERGRLVAGVEPLPAELVAHPGWFVPALPGADEERQIAEAAAKTPPGRRLFLVIPPAFATPGLARAFAAPGGRARELMRSPDAVVLLRTRDR